MFVDTGGWITPSDPPPREPAFFKRQETTIASFILISSSLGLVALIGSWAIVEAMVAVSGRW